MPETPAVEDTAALTAADVRTMELATTRKGDVRAEAVEQLREQVCETLAMLYGRIAELEDTLKTQTQTTAEHIEQLEQDRTEIEADRQALQDKVQVLETELDTARKQVVDAEAENARLRDTVQQTTAKLVELREELDTARSQTSSVEAVEILAMAQKTAADMIAKAQQDIETKLADASRELEVLDEMRRQAVADADAVTHELTAAEAATRNAMRELATQLLAVAESGHGPSGVDTGADQEDSSGDDMLANLVDADRDDRGENGGIYTTSGAPVRAW